MSFMVADSASSNMTDEISGRPQANSSAMISRSSDTDRGQVKHVTCPCKSFRPEEQSPEAQWEAHTKPYQMPHYKMIKIKSYVNKTFSSVL